VIESVARPASPRNNRLRCSASPTVSARCSSKWRPGGTTTPSPKPLYMSDRAVEKHIGSIFRKLGLVEEGEHNRRVVACCSPFSKPPARRVDSATCSTSLWQSYRIVIGYLNTVGLRGKTPSSAPWSLNAAPYDPACRYLGCSECFRVAIC
jgi:hypothetical protein